MVVENLTHNEFRGEERCGKGFCYVKNTSPCLFGEHPKKSRNANKGKYKRLYSILGSYQPMLHKNPEERTPTPPRKPESRISIMFDVLEDKFKSVLVTVLGQHVERNTL